MPTELETARTHWQVWVDNYHPGGPMMRPINAEDIEYVSVLLAATEPAPGELGEAVDGCERWCSLSDRRAPATVQGNTNLAKFIRTVCQAVREAQVALALAGTPIEQAQTATTSGALPEQQAEQPEADPEAVSRHLRDVRRWTDRALQAMLNGIPGWIENMKAQAAAIRQVLKERGETDG